METTMDNKSIARSLYADLTAGRMEIIDEVVAEGFVEHEVTPEGPGGRAGLHQLFQALHAAFADFSMTVEDMVAEGDKVFVLATMSGIQRAEFMGIPSSGRPMAVPVADVMRFENGRVVEHWGVTDSGMLMQQLMPPSDPS
jgi:steroid delta-isomerase-like uncharacterized protein